jgi:hypothetical protein
VVRGGKALAFVFGLRAGSCGGNRGGGGAVNKDDGAVWTWDAWGRMIGFGLTRSQAVRKVKQVLLFCVSFLPNVGGDLPR